MRRWLSPVVIRGHEVTRLVGSRTSGEDWNDPLEPPIPRQADPPLSGGVEHHSAGDAVIGGGADDFPNPESLVSQDGLNLWSLVLGQQSSVESEICEVMQLLRDEPDHMAGARLKALAEVQALLRQTPAGTRWEATVNVPAGDLLLIVQMAMARLR